MSKIWVVGGATVDICGHAKNEILLHDSNISSIDLSFGGVGRNIAEMCAIFSESINFISVFSNDSFGRAIYNDCLNLGMNLDYSLTSDKYPSSIYLAILDKDNDMYLGMSDMGILELLDIELLDKALKDIKEDDYLVIDGNLSEEIASYVVNNTSATIVCDPVSVAKVNRLRNVIGEIDIYKPNKYEAKEYTGIEIVDEETARSSLQWFIDKGVKEIIITLSSKGLLLGTKEKVVWIKTREAKMVNANGAGDTLLGTYISKRLEGMEAFEAIKYAMSAALIVVENEEGKKKVNSKIVEDSIEDLKIEEIVLWK